MRRKPSERADRDPRAEWRPVEAMLVEAGLSPVRVERCPDPACPLCERARRAAA